MSFLNDDEHEGKQQMGERPFAPTRGQTLAPTIIRPTIILSIKGKSQRSKFPAVGGGGTAVGFGDIHLSNAGIMAHHVKRAVTEEGLEGENITPGAQVGNGEGVAEFVRVDVFHLCAGGDAFDKLAKTILGEGVAAVGDEEGQIKVLTVIPFGKVKPDSFAGDFAQVY